MDKEKNALLRIQGAAHFIKGFAEPGGRNLPEVLSKINEIIKAANELESIQKNKKAMGFFWQTADGRLHFSQGSINPKEIHDNGKPVHVAYLGEEAPLIKTKR